MKISKYIGEILFEYECIVIPGFGGFITNDIPAKIQNDQRTFIPPSKKIVFNAFLKTNDGLLINQIAKAENISYADSKNKVESFVDKCFIALNDGKKINFQKVGVLFFDAEKNIQFKADLNQNYFAESYGMTSFISPPIRRKTNLHIIEKKFVDRKPKPKSKSQIKEKQNQEFQPLSSPKVKRPRYIKINVFTLLILAGIIYLGVKNPARIQNFYNNYSNFVPFFFQTPNEFIVENIENIPLDKILPKTKKENTLTFKPTDSNNNLSATKKLITVEPEALKKTVIPEKAKPSINKKQTSTTNTKPIITKPEEPKINTSEKTPEIEIIPKSKKYFIVAGSFNSIENAQNFNKELNNKGFESEIIGQSKYGSYRVSYNGFNSLAEARKQLVTIKQDENEAAWIFSK